MKAIKLFLFFAIGALFLFSCRDESLNPVPKWETGVHGYGATAKTAVSKKDTLVEFSQKDVNKPIWFSHYWQSLDNKNTVAKIEFFVYWNEYYVDENGNSKTAPHGGTIFSDPGKLFKTVTAPKGNREVENHALTQAEIYNLYKDAKFDYKDGKGTVAVFDGKNRTAAKPFNDNDEFLIRWKLTAADGRVFEVWGPDSICAGEVLGANCEVDFYVGQ
jgi:hypothetical protein